MIPALVALGLAGASSLAGDIAGGGSADNATARPAAGPDDCHEVVCWTAASFEGDIPTHLILHQFDIVYPLRGTTISGDQAEGETAGRGATDYHWVLAGHVQISLPQGHLSADHATMQVVKGRISSMTAEGSPAQFERSADAPAPTGAPPGTQAALEHAHGHARQIVYDLEHGQLELSGDSYLTNGCYEITSEHLVYDIANQRVHADPRDGGVRGRITCNHDGGNKP